MTNVQKGDVPSRYQSLATYVAKYVVSPPISLRRIDRYDGHQVTYHYRSHKSEQVERETVDVYTCIGRMIQHVFPKGFQRVRYDGVQATKTFAKIKHVIHEALATGKGIVKGAIKIIAPMTYRQRYQQSTGQDPLCCPHCHSDMGVWRIWHPTYGVIHDELEAMRRGKYASKEIRAAPAGGARRALWAALIEYLYRCSVCGEEMLVNEAITEVGIGMAKCQREYHAGFMPKVGCPGWNGYTMEDVDQEV